jgi:YihY family inner membrane protein
VAVTDLPERGVRAFDRFQAERWWLAHPVGIVRKYADDRGSAFAGLLTFQVFLGMLPLLVVVLTVLGRMIDADPDLEEAILESTIAQFPVIGAQLEDDIAALRPDGIWVAVSIAGLLWTAAGIYHGMQLALNQTWNVQGVVRQGFVSRHIRALILFALVVAAAIGTAFVRGQVTPPGPGWLVPIASAAGSAALAMVLLMGVFRIAVSPTVPTVLLAPAAVLAGLSWELLQRLGTWLVADRLAQAQDLYGSIGFVVVTLFWINLLARSAILANEYAVVSWRKLWPRRIAQPPLTKADRLVLESLVGNERRRPEMHVSVRWDDDADRPPDGGDEDSDHSGAERAPGQTVTGP